MLGPTSPRILCPCFCAHKRCFLLGMLGKVMQVSGCRDLHIYRRPVADVSHSRFCCLARALAFLELYAVFCHSMTHMRHLRRARACFQVLGDRGQRWLAAETLRLCMRSSVFFFMIPAACLCQDVSAEHGCKICRFCAIKTDQ